MSTLRYRTEIAVRIFLIAAVIFNALAPTFRASARADLPQNKNAVFPNEMAESTYQPPSFIHQTPRYGERPPEIANPQAFGATIQCTNSDCTQPSPDIVLREELDYHKHWNIFNYSVTRQGFDFLVQCNGVNCARNVYYRIWGTLDWTASSYFGFGREPFLDVGGSGSRGWGTGYVRVDCGSHVYTGSCTIDAAGVVRSGLIGNSVVSVLGSIEPGG